MMRVESPIVFPFIFSTGNVAPRVIANAQTVCIIGIGALRTCGMPLVVECPAGLLVVVRDLDVVQHGGRHGRKPTYDLPPWHRRSS